MIALSSPNSIKLSICFLKQSQLCWIVSGVIMLRISVRPLGEILQGGLLTAAQAKQITRQLCMALWVLHSLGVVHRDVKPDNVIIRGTEAVLIDFDASRIYKNENREDTQILGTTGFAAPEQYGLSQSDGRADIYALGVLLNIMLTAYCFSEFFIV